jgi:adenylate cyclase
VFYSYAIMALATYAAGDYDEAAQWARRSAALNPRFNANLRFLAAVLAASGEAEEAHVAAETLLRFDPKFRARKFADGHAFKDPEMRRRFCDHLVLAGLPE